MLIKLSIFYLSLLKSISHLINRHIERLNQWLFFKLFEPRDSDIYIVTHAKSGTTLTQMLLHQLLNQGGADFEHIYEVSPWLDDMKRNPANAKRLNAMQGPRFFKTHADYSFIPKKLKGRFIYVRRNGMDVALSTFHHIRNYANPELQWPAFIDSFLDGSRQHCWFTHVKNWQDNPRELAVLYLNYEELTQNIECSCEKIAQFLLLDLTPEHIANAKSYCSFAYMKQHQHKFGEQPPKTKRVYDQFIREGKSNKGKEAFSPQQRARFERLEQKYLGERLGAHPI